jgi:hypothetical protein
MIDVLASASSEMQLPLRAPAFRGGAGGTSMPKQRVRAGRIILLVFSLAGLRVLSSVSQPLMPRVPVVNARQFLEEAPSS